MTSNEDEKKAIGLYNIVSEKFSQSTAALTETKSSKDTKSNYDDDDPDTSCGFGSWTPRWLQKAAHPRLFLFFYSMAGIAQGAGFTYFVGCISTMEKRYAYDTRKSGLIMIADEIPPILLGVLVGYFGGLTHRPRLLSFGMFIGALGSFVFALPYFLYGSGRFDENLQRASTRLSGVNAQICDRNFNEIEISCNKSATTDAATFFFIANFLKGISGVVYYAIGTAYVDDSVQKKNSPMYMSEYRLFISSDQLLAECLIYNMLKRRHIQLYLQIAYSKIATKVSLGLKRSLLFENSKKV